MKKFFSLLLIIVTLCALASCGDEASSEAPSGMMLASDTEIVDYFLYVPTDWVVTSATGMTMAQLSLADKTSVIVTNFSNGKYPELSDKKEMLTTYYDDFEATLTASFDKLTDGDGNLILDEEGNTKSSLEIVSEPSFITLKKGDKEVAALKVVYTATLAETEVQQVLVVAYNSSDACFYNITFTTVPDFYDDNEDTFDKIIENFEFED